MSDPDPRESATFEALGNERSRVSGPLVFGTVGPLLRTGSEAIAHGTAEVIDLTGVTRSDSSALALLIEWLSVARAAGKPLRFEGIPAQLRHLAQLSEVETLISGS